MHAQSKSSIAQRMYSLTHASVKSIFRHYPLSLFSLPFSDKNARIGRFSCLTMTAIICECLLQVKIGWDILTIPLHWSAYVVWALGGLLFSLWVFWHFTFPFILAHSMTSLYLLKFVFACPCQISLRVVACPLCDHGSEKQLSCLYIRVIPIRASRK